MLHHFAHICISHILAIERRQQHCKLSLQITDCLVLTIQAQLLLVQNRILLVKELLLFFQRSTLLLQTLLQERYMASFRPLETWLDAGHSLQKRDSVSFRSGRGGIPKDNA
jgi:hypothetical protein